MFCNVNTTENFKLVLNAFKNSEIEVSSGYKLTNGVHVKIKLANIVTKNYIDFKATYWHVSIKLELTCPNSVA